MKKVKVFVWHNVNGEITAVGRPVEQYPAVPMSGENQFLLETEIEEKDISELHKTHLVDMHQKSIVKHSTGGKSS